MAIGPLAIGDRRRDLVLWVARQCTGLTLEELGKGTGGMDYAAVTMAIRRFPGACERDKALSRLAKQVLKNAQSDMLIPLKNPCVL